MLPVSLAAGQKFRTPLILKHNRQFVSRRSFRPSQWATRAHASTQCQGPASGPRGRQRSGVVQLGGIEKFLGLAQVLLGPPETRGDLIHVAVGGRGPGPIDRSFA